MKLWEFATAGLLVSMVGCTSMQKKTEEAAPSEKVSELVDTGKPKTAVPADLELQPDQVDETNAHDAAKRMREGMEKQMKPTTAR